MANAIVEENLLNGAPQSEWDVQQRGSTNIEGFATDISINRGTTVDFKINADAGYRVEIYRLGYYGGDGARKVATLGNFGASSQSAPLRDATTGLVDAGNWAVSASWAVPSDAVSGLYIAKLTRADGSGDNQIPFIVRNDASKSDVVFQTSDTTWHAYNSWGSEFDATGQTGANFYPGGNGPPSLAGSFGPGRATKVSYNRPIATRDGGFAAGPQDYIFGAEYAAIYWLEQNGYDVSYIAGVDTDRAGAKLLDHKVFTSTGHDEYWSGAQRANVEAARDSGLNLAFLSGNEVYWKTRWENSISADGKAYRTLVCYKETWSNGDIDPSNEWTGTWRDGRFTSPTAQGGGNNENALTGTIFAVDSYRRDAIQVPQEMTQLRFWRDTALAQANQTAALTQNILGYEWDASPDDRFRPEGLIKLSSTTLDVGSLLLDEGNRTGPGTATHNLTLYRADSGALVFGAGTVYWSWGLSDRHDLDATPTDKNIQQAMINLLADMGVQPGSLQTGLKLAFKSTDVVAPTTTLATSDGNNSAAQGRVVTITGTATDNDGNAATADGKVAAVEVSTDGGTTWRVATGTTSWTYSYTARTPGQQTVLARAIDDSVNMQSGNYNSLTLNVTASPFAEFFADDLVPGRPAAGDHTPVELGVKFQSSAAGVITGVQFYKAPGETGSHTGKLWNSSGQLLSTVAFGPETTSGWQTATFATAVPIAANTTYVASYGTNFDYAADAGYFTTALQSGPLTALASPSGATSSGGNGVYKYGTAGEFPTDSFNASNYYVDVLFSATSGPNPPPEITSGSGNTASFTVPENSSAVTTVVATDPDGTTPSFQIVLPVAAGDPGADGALFNISPTGALSFKSAPNFEQPADNGLNNIYDVRVRAQDARDATLFDEQTIAVTVTDVLETPRAGVGFDGRTIRAEYLFDVNAAANPPGQLGSNSPTNVVVVDGTGPELVGFPGGPASDTGSRGLANVDIEAAEVLFTFPVDGGSPLTFTPRAFNGPRLSDVADGVPRIAGATILSQTGFIDGDGAGPEVAGIEASDIITTENSVYVYLGGETRSDGATLRLAVNFAPDITSNGAGATATVNVSENTTAVATVTAQDANAGSTLTYGIVGGEDRALFQIDATTGALALITPLDFEAPANAGVTPGYQVDVQVADAGGGTDTQAITVNLTNQADATPVISSNGGGPTATISVAENTVAVTTVVASDADGTAPAYALAGGADASLFGINSTSGALTFLVARDAENRTDANGDGTYEVIVSASDGVLTDSQALAVTVTNVNDNAPVVARPLPGQTGTQGQAFSYTVPAGTFTDADGDVLSYTATNLPSGLTISSLGVISGTPTASGTFTAAVSAFDGQTSTPTNFTLTLAPAQPPSGTGPTIGSGPDKLVLQVQQDAYQGNARYNVSLDGVQVGPTQTASATRASGQSDTLTVLADLAPGSHTVAIAFVNDLYDGSPDKDRNLFVTSGTYNGDTIAFTAKELFSPSTAFIDFREAGVVPPATIGSGPDKLVLQVQQDAYQGNARYNVSVDGVQVGPTQTASATRASGQSDTLTVLADLSPGSHTVAIAFVNDLYDGSPDKDRNLFVTSGTYNGDTIAFTAKELFSPSTAFIDFREAGVVPPATIGSGPDKLVLQVQQDAYQGDARYNVSLDGVQVGPTQTASATRASGQSDTLTVLADLTPGSHTVAIAFVNDLYDGSPDKDRNLYVTSGTYNGDTIAFTAKELFSPGTAFIDFREAGVVPPATIGSGPDKLVLQVQQDAYQGNARYNVSVDGMQVGPTQTASATRASGQFDTLTVLADLAAGGHTVAVNFLNDLYDGSADKDRNLYVNTITYNGASVSNTETAFFNTGAASFSFTDRG